MAKPFSFTKSSAEQGEDVSRGVWGAEQGGGPNHWCWLSVSEPPTVGSTWYTVASGKVGYGPVGPLLKLILMSRPAGRKEEEEGLDQGKLYGVPHLTPMS